MTHLRSKATIVQCKDFQCFSIKNMDRTRIVHKQTDGQGDFYIPPQTLFAGSIIIDTILSKE